LPLLHFPDAPLHMASCSSFYGSRHCSGGLASWTLYGQAWRGILPRKLSQLH
jgi:hypothetical protein